MSKLSGFPEYLPAERHVELALLDHLRSTFELHGFANIETRAVETMDTLTRKGDINKEVYVIKRVHAEAGEDSGMGLHFDLTVPFARYVVENAGQLAFPFRRYQIQKVWRGERPQQGRFREFVQADIDIVGDGALPFHADVEVARVMAEALAGAPLGDIEFVLQVSNRKVLEGFYLGLGISDPTAVMQIVDKLDKLSAEKIHELLAEAGLSPVQAQSCLALAEICTTDSSFVDQVRALGVEHEMLDEGLSELAAVVNGCAGIAGVTVTADLRIARGLDYYTGTVFETRMVGYESLGSVCSGGRYDQLATSGKRTYPGVGISLGVSRLLAPLFAAGLTTDRAVPSVVYIAVDDEVSRANSTAIAQKLRSRGVPCEVAAQASKFGKQIRAAERRGIPYVWFPASNEVKDIRSGDQVEADPDSWLPAENDLRPQVIVKETDA